MVPPPLSDANAVDVVVPVYGAAPALAACLRSVAAHTNLQTHRLLLVADGPQPAACESLLVEQQAMPGVEVLRLAERRGFPAAANLGLRASQRDVILLNSDTIVTRAWVEKLAAAAHADAQVATATPFSNNATICSIPRWLESNTLPAGHDVDSFAALVESVSAQARPRLPTGVGVCLFMRRAAIATVGPLDEAAFGFGYGEEVDWCMRAARAGFLHALDDATFIFHEGQRSFGGERARRVRRAHRVLCRRYPEYLASVARFLREDPLRPLRERILRALAPPRAPYAKGASRVVHIVHGWPPWSPFGTETYAAGLARRQAASREVAVYARLADADRGSGEVLEHFDRGARVRLVVNNFEQRNPFVRNGLRWPAVEGDFRRLLAEFRPALVHVHHLAGHCAKLPQLARRSGAAVVYQLQDWWGPCARANLYDHERHLCSGPTTSKCGRCLPLTRKPPRTLLNHILYFERRRLLKEALRQADLLVAGSRFVMEDHQRLGWLPAGTPVRVLSYGIEPLARPARSPERPRFPLRFGVIGSILPHKGVHVAAAAFATVSPQLATLEIWGDPTADPVYVEELRRLAGPALQLQGRFPDERKAEIIAGLDVLVVPSCGLESFGLVVREAWSLRTPVLVSDRGALADPALEEGPGARFVADDPEALRAWVERLVAQPEILAAWRARSPRLKTMDEHVEEIDKIYVEALDLRRMSRS